MRDEQPSPLAVDVKGAAALLGCSEGLVRKMTLRREIPFAKLGARTVYPVEELQRWLKSRVLPPIIGEMADDIERFGERLREAKSGLPPQ